MSRILLNNQAVVHRVTSVGAAASSFTIQKLQSPLPPTTPSAASSSSSLAIRRWKSIVHGIAIQKQNSIASRRSRTEALDASGTHSSLLVNVRSVSASSGGGAAAVSSASSCVLNSASPSSVAAMPQQTNSLNNSAMGQTERNYSTSTSLAKCLQVENINPNYVVMEYAVRGPLVIRAGEIEKELQKGVQKPFKEVIRANIGDCHAMGQRPVTFLRQLLTLTFNPSLLDSSEYPEDVKERARTILNFCQGHSVGSYTDSAGIEVVRRQVADFIAKRDGIPSDWHNIFLTAGATPGIKSILGLIRCDIDGKKPGVMVPIPQYPLYSATIAEYGMEKIDFYLEEETGWSLNRKELQRAYDEAKSRCNPRALVVINPGNPTGQVLTRENVVEIIKFAYENKLIILADEVYQDNVYDRQSKFFSFKKVIHEMGAPYSEMELISFLSASKGYLGECGIRGGYMEILNLCPKVMATLAKSITASLCSTTAGQVAISALVHPPQPGEPSYEKYISEKNATLAALKERAELVHKTLSTFEGYKVNPVQGAMYIFPRIEIPPKAIQAAKAKNMEPDVFYAFELLETTGICIVPGSGFGQKPGTYHFRSTILPQTDKLKLMMEQFQKFHKQFMQKYK